jgi:Rps23 Pro-64 3,4-dihydroxylase Tpa1-like proline 4-hydroxylase
MPNHRDRFIWLAHQFELVTADLEKAATAEQRRESLRRMRVIIDEVDELIDTQDLELKQDNSARSMTRKKLGRSHWPG